MADRIARRAEYVSPAERARRLEAMETLAAEIRQAAELLRAAESVSVDDMELRPLRH